MSGTGTVHTAFFNMCAAIQCLQMYVAVSARTCGRFGNFSGILEPELFGLNGYVSFQKARCPILAFAFASAGIWDDNDMNKPRDLVA